MEPLDDNLNTLRRTSPANADYLDDLQAYVTGLTQIPLVPFVGAGLSIPMGFPSWKQFLLDLAKECNHTRVTRQLVSSGAFERAAGVLERQLTAEVFHARVAQAFGARRTERAMLNGPVLLLPRLGSGLVVTTNFDRILERTFATAGSAFEQVVWGSQVDSIRRAITDGKHVLLKVHGDAEERTGRVLTSAEYNLHYKAGSSRGLRVQLESLFGSRTLLFIGCSLGKDRTLRVLANLLRRTSGIRHYAIVEKPPSDAAVIARQAFLGKCGIHPIWYPQGRHDLVEVALRWLVANREGGAQHSAAHDARPLAALGYIASTGSTPPFPSRIIGRDADVGTLKTMLLAAQTHTGSRCICVQGAPGVGKSTVLASLAHEPEILRQFPDPPLYTSLGEHADIDAVFVRWCEELGVPTPRYDHDLRYRLAALLRDRRTLLIVDDVYRAADAAHFMLGGRDCAVVLATRFPEVARELVVPNDYFHLGPLASENDRQMLLGSLAPTVVKDYPVETRQLANSLGGFPLWIEMAGRLLNANAKWGVAAILRELHDDACRVLRERAPVSVGANTGIAVLERSVAFLGETAKVGFSKLGVLAPKPALFDVAAIEAILDLPDCRSIAQALENNGLIEVPAPGRFWMHGVIGAFARSLAPSDDLKDSHIRHSAYFSDVLGECERSFIARSAKPSDGNNRFEEMWENIRIGQANAAKYAAQDSRAAESCISFALGGLGLLRARRCPLIRLQWLEAARTYATQQERPDEHLLLLNGLGVAHMDQGSFDEAAIAFAAARRAAQQSAIAHQESRALSGLSSVSRLSGNATEAARYAKQALHLARASGDLEGEVLALDDLGLACRDRDKWHLAGLHFDAALVLCRRLKDRHLQASILSHLGTFHRHAGSPQRAIKEHQEATALSHELGDMSSEGYALLSLGMAHAACHDENLAMQCYEESLRIFRLLGDRRGEAYVHINIGADLSTQGQFFDAETHTDLAFSTLRDLGDWRGLGDALANAAIIRAKIGEVGRQA